MLGVKDWLSNPNPEGTGIPRSIVESMNKNRVSHDNKLKKIKLVHSHDQTKC